MKLKLFNTTNCSYIPQKKRPSLSIHKKGMISLSGDCCSLMSVKIGDRIQMYQNEECPEDWYIAKEPDESTEGFTLRSLGSKAKGLSFSSVALTQVFFKSAGIEHDKAVRFKVSSEPEKVGKSKLYYILVGTAQKYQP